MSRLLDNEASVSSDTVQETGSSDGNSVDELSTEDQSSFSKRRRLLLVAKNVTSAAPARNVGVSMIERVQAEVSKYLDFGGCIEMSENPCNWWRQYGAQFPLMNKFFIANCAFPATSTSSERAFSMDGLILIPQRRRLDPNRTENLVICRDYWMSRTEAESFKLCQMCPQPPSSAACYKISCAKHQKK